MVLQWAGFTIISDPDDLDKFLNGTPSPFNLRSDYKRYAIDDLTRLSTSIAAELTKGVRDKSCNILEGSAYGVCALKIRYHDEEGGKRGGLRVFVLVLTKQKTGYVLGIKSHTKGSQKNTTLTRKEQKRLTQLRKEVERAVNAQTKEKTNGNQH